MNHFSKSLKNEVDFHAVYHSATQHILFDPAKVNYSFFSGFLQKAELASLFILMNHFSKNLKNEVDFMPCIILLSA